MDIILVLGHVLLPTGAVSPRFQARIDEGIRLLSRNPQAVLVLSGGVTLKGLPSEAEAGFRIIPEWFRARVVLDTKSTTTTDHPRFVRGMLEARGIHADTLIVVTDRNHEGRIKRAFKKFWPQMYPTIRFACVGRCTPIEQLRELVLSFLSPELILVLKRVFRRGSV